MHGTPRSIDKNVIKFCNTINPMNNPEVVIVKSDKESKENYCFINVDNAIKKCSEYEKVKGWVIWQRDNMYLEAEAHCVIKLADGALIDITPHTPQEETIVFIEDDEVSYSGQQIGNKYYPLTDSGIVKEYIRIWERKYTIDIEVESGNKRPDEVAAEYEILIARGQELETQFNKKVGRNEECPCGSELKYKKCCGRYR